MTCLVETTSLYNQPRLTPEVVLLVRDPGAKERLSLLLVSYGVPSCPHDSRVEKHCLEMPAISHDGRHDGRRSAQTKCTKCWAAIVSNASRLERTQGSRMSLQLAHVEAIIHDQHSRLSLRQCVSFEL